MNKIPRGFTLIELMIIVAVAGILAIVVVPTVVSRLLRSDETEAVHQLNILGSNATRFYEATRSFYVGTAAATPRPPGKGCCGGGAPNDHCAVDATTFDAPAWKALGFRIDEPTRFYYDYRGTATSFTAHATGDLDCDGTEITYTLHGIVVSGKPTVVITEPPPNSD